MSIVKKSRRKVPFRPIGLRPTEETLDRLMEIIERVIGCDASDGYARGVIMRPLVRKPRRMREE